MKIWLAEYCQLIKLEAGGLLGICKCTVYKVSPQTSNPLKLQMQTRPQEHPLPFSLVILVTGGGGGRGGRTTFSLSSFT